jgi:hypothetical protein
MFAAVNDVPPFAKRNNVIKMQFVRGPTDRALSTIPLPHFQFDLGWDQAAALCIDVHRLSEILFPLDSHQLELEDHPILVALRPGIYEVEDSVV